MENTKKITIRLEHIGKNIKGSQVLKDVSLTMTSGIVYGIEGTNGSGKTMLMRVIAGLIFPTEGKWFINDKEMHKGSTYPVSLGMLIENPAFLPNYSGKQNLKLLAGIKGVITEEEIDAAIKEVGLEPTDKRKYKKYSLGMKQRLGIAAALMERADIIILDEPVNALDASGVEMMKELIRREKARGALVILSCHDKKFLIEASDCMYQMSEGRLTEMGDSL